MFSIDFTAAFNSWDKVDPAQLYDAPTIKLESNPKVGLIAVQVCLTSPSLITTLCRFGTLPPHYVAST